KRFQTIGTLAFPRPFEARVVGRLAGRRDALGSAACAAALGDPVAPWFEYSVARLSWRVDLSRRRVYIPSAMRFRFSTLAAVAFALTIAASITAQQPEKPPLPKGQMPEPGRPTKVGDELPLFDFDGEFTGRWSFEWDMPEGVL